MNTSPSTKERAYLLRVKSLPCSVCDMEGPSQAHHISQDCAWTCVALCPSCHGGPNNPEGWHGRKTLWKIKKLDMLDALAVTIERLA